MDIQAATEIQNRKGLLNTNETRCDFMDLSSPIWYLFFLAGLCLCRYLRALGIAFPPGAQALPHHIVKVRGVREGFYVGRGYFWLSFLSVGNSVYAVFADYVGDTSLLSRHTSS